MAAGTVAMPVDKPESVRIAGDVLRMARIVSAIENVTLADLLGDIIRPVLKKKLEEYQRRGFDLNNPPKK